MINQPQQSKSKFCVDCQHHKTIDNHYHSCVAPKYNPVTGEKVEHVMNCYDVRAIDGHCGPDAKLFEVEGVEA